jgi:hypothetical protein
MTLACMIPTGRWLAFASAIALAACASTPPPKTELNAAQLAVGEAEEANARTHAPSILQKAREKLARARQAAEDEQMLEARRLAEQAAVDAQLAEAEARAATAEANLQEIQQGMDQLREKTMPTSPATTTTGG